MPWQAAQLQSTVKPVFKTTWEIGTTWELRTATSVPGFIHYVEMDLRNKTILEFRTVSDSPLGVPNSQVPLYKYARRIYLWSATLQTYRVTLSYFNVEQLSDQHKNCVWTLATWATTSAHSAKRASFLKSLKSTRILMHGKAALWLPRWLLNLSPFLD